MKYQAPRGKNAPPRCFPHNYQTEIRLRSIFILLNLILRRTKMKFLKNITKSNDLSLFRDVLIHHLNLIELHAKNVIRIDYKRLVFNNGL